MSRVRQKKENDQYLATIRLYIKRQLRLKKITYQMLGKRLNVSEITIKRWMTSQQIRLKDLQKISQILDFDLTWPVNFGGKDRIHSEEYTLKQEEYFSAKPHAFLLFIKLIVGFDLEAARIAANVQPKNLIRLLREMERLHILKLGEGNHITVHLGGPFRWRKLGPIVHTYHAVHSSLIFNYLMKKHPHPPMQENDALQGFIWPFETHLTPESTKDLKVELHQLLCKYRTISALERKSKLKTEPISIIGAVGEFDAWAATLR